MKKVRQLYNMFMMASMAHAKWDYETSMNIIKDKKTAQNTGSHDYAGDPGVDRPGRG